MTRRLLLRKLRREDVRRIYDCWAADPEVTKYLTWDPHDSIAVTEAVMDLWLASYERPDTYRWGICVRETNELIGMIDVVRFTDGCPVVGYCSGKAYWNRGYMTEALGAVKKELFDAGYPAVIMEAEVQNIGSNRVIQKNGFVFTGTRPVPELTKRKPWIRTVNTYRLDRE